MTAKLQDERIKHFTPVGLATAFALTPEASLRYVQALVAGSDLRAAVPDDVRDHFELCRKLHVYGYLAYEFFAAAWLHAVFTLELALRVRLVELHPADAYQINHRDTFGPLLEHAQADGLVSEQDYDLQFIRRLRNEAAHPKMMTILAPPTSARAIRATAGFVDYLWRA